MASLHRLLVLLLTFAAATTVSGQAVFCHVIVGNDANYTLARWVSDIKLAASFDIDAFVLNIAPPLNGTTSAQVKLAFNAARQLGSKFKLFLSFDYLGGAGPWQTQDIVTLLTNYSSSPAYFYYDSRPFVSTFEGPQNSDVNQWATVRSSIPGGIYFVPDWTSQGPGWNQNLYDGIFSWNMWPNGPNNISTQPDQAWQASLKSGQTYMMGVSPWFYTSLPAYHKAWVWRGDSLWYDRWQETLTVKPQFVEIVSWNDFGESHYVGPIFGPGIPNATNADAVPYVQGFPHQAWLQTLPWQIAAYKHAINKTSPAPVVKKGADKIIYWYRTAPAAAGSTNCTGNCAVSPINTQGYQQAYPIDEILEDSIYAIALLYKPATVSIAVGSNAAYTFTNLSAGINFIGRPFAGQVGNVTVKSSSGCSGEGVAIVSEPADGIANFNAWVGLAKIST